MRVDQTQVTQSTAAASTARRKPAGTSPSFGTSLARAATATAVTGVQGQNTAPSTAQQPAAPAKTLDAKAQAKAEAIAQAQAQARAKGLLKTPKGEKYADIPRHAYDEITAGPRNGMFINRSGNVRDGQAFVRVERGDRTFHIYGSGKSRLVVEVRHRPDTDAKATPPATTRALAPATPVTTGGATAA